MRPNDQTPDDALAALLADEAGSDWLPAQADGASQNVGLSAVADTADLPRAALPAAPPRRGRRRRTSGDDHALVAAAEDLDEPPTALPSPKPRRPRLTFTEAAEVSEGLSEAVSAEPPSAPQAPAELPHVDEERGISRAPRPFVVSETADSGLVRGARPTAPLASTRRRRPTRPAPLPVELEPVPMADTEEAPGSLARVPVPVERHDFDEVAGERAEPDDTDGVSDACDLFGEIAEEELTASDAAAIAAPVPLLAYDEPAELDPVVEAVPASPPTRPTAARPRRMLLPLAAALLATTAGAAVAAASVTADTEPLPSLQASITRDTVDHVTAALDAQLALAVRRAEQRARAERRAHPTPKAKRSRRPVAIPSSVPAPPPATRISPPTTRQHSVPACNSDLGPC